MKAKMIQDEGIGATINRFERMEQQNIENFNMLFFNCKLTGFDPSFSVVIGEYNSGLREVTINDTIKLRHEFSHIDYTMGDRVMMVFVLSYPDGKTIGKFNSMTEAAEELDTDTVTLKAQIAKGKYKFEELKHD